MLVVASDVEDDGHHEVHALAVSDLRVHVSDGTENSLKFLLSLLCLRPCCGICPRQINLNLIRYFGIEAFGALAARFRFLTPNLD